MNIFDVRSIALFWYCHLARGNGKCYGKKLHIQNQRKLNEEILVSRRLYFEKELESLDGDSQKIGNFDSLDPADVATYTKRLAKLSQCLKIALQKR